MQQADPPVVQALNIETTPDGLTSNFILKTDKGDIVFALKDGALSLIVEMLLKHLADVASKSKPTVQTSRQLVANPIPISGLARANADSDSFSYFVVTFGNLQITFQVQRSTLNQFSADVVAELERTLKPLPTPSTQQIATPPSSYSLRPTRILPVVHKIRTGGPTLKYPDLGACAYCGTKVYGKDSSLELTEEHIIADGFGGTLVLPKASCEEHQKKTTTIEGSILRTIFLAPRAHLGIRSRKKKRKPVTVFPVKATVDGREIIIPLSLEQHPTVLYLINFGPPGILVGRPKQLGDFRGVWVKAFNLSIDHLQKSHGIQSISSDVTDLKRFYQFLAKTAHALAVAELGFDGFRPLLRKVIDGHFNFSDMHYLIGGYPETIPPSDALHEVGLERRQHGAKGFVVAKLRFFANLGAPTYCVVAGELPAGP